MAAWFPGKGTRVYTDPKTESHVRSVLNELNSEAEQVDSEIEGLEETVGLVSATFGSAAAAGQPLYVTSADNVDLADASALATSSVIGLASVDTMPGNGQYQAVGRVTVSDWTAVTGSAALVAGSMYYLGTTAGTLTTVAPTTVGQVVLQVGEAIDQETMQLIIGLRILL